MKKLLTISGVTFVAAWIVGLMAATNCPKPSAPCRAQRLLHEPRGCLRVADVLVDALAGLAIVGITIGLSRIFPRAGNSHRRLHRRRGLAVSGRGRRDAGSSERRLGQPSARSCAVRRAQ
jgi:hypothetical protein